MLFEDRFMVQTASERLKFISKNLNNLNYPAIQSLCLFPCRSEKEVFDEIQSICYMGNLEWVKMQVNDYINRGKNNTIVLIENKELPKIKNWIKEQSMSIEYITDCSYINFSYYKITFKEE